MTPPDVALVGAGALGWGIGEILAADPAVTHLVVSDPSPPDPTLHPRAGLAATSGEALVRRIRHLSDRRRAGQVGHWSELDGLRPTLTVVATTTPEPDRAITEHLTRHDLPHLPVRLSDHDVRIGPLVEPGRTPCLRCVDTLRTDSDPDWPAALLAQTSTHCEPGPAILTTWGAAMAAVQVVSYLGTGHADTIGCTIELAVDDLLVRVRHWRRHPACGCGWWTD